MDQMNERNLNDVDDMEQKAKYTIITLEDEEDIDSKSKQVLHDVSDKLTILYSEFREWMKVNAQSDRVQEQKEKLKAESDHLLQMAKDQMQKLKENEDLHKTIDKGIKIATDTGNWIYETVNDGVNEVMKKESVAKLVSNVDEVVQSVKQDERVKQGVVSLKKSTLKLAEHAFNGLKKALDTEHTEESEAEVQENEKNNNL